MSHTILASTTAILWKSLKSTGFDPAPLFLQADIDPELMKDPQARVSGESVLDLWQWAVELTGDDCLGITAAKHWHPSMFGALGYAWLASSTLRTALNRAARYMLVINNARDALMEETAAGFNYRLFPELAIDMLSVQNDIHLAVLIKMCRANYGEPLNPLSVTFTHAEPNCSKVYFAHFRCPVEFGAEENCLTLPMEAIDKPLPGNNPMMAQLSDQVMIEYLSHLDKSQFTQRVKALIIEHLPSEDIQLEKLAKLLAVSTRTLQRRLKDEETSFANLLEEIRRDLASRYILANTHSLTEISFLLGFSDESAFSRAFKRWTGQSPSEYSHRP